MPGRYFRQTGLDVILPEGRRLVIEVVDVVDLLILDGLIEVQLGPDVQLHRHVHLYFVAFRVQPVVRQEGPLECAVVMTVGA